MNRFIVYRQHATMFGRHYHSRERDEAIYLSMCSDRL